MRKDHAENREYKKKGDEPEEEKKEAPAEEEKAVKVKYEEVVVGYSFDEVMGGRNFGGRKEARAAEGVKAKVSTNDNVKEKQSTVLQAQYMKGTTAPVAGEGKSYLGIGSVPDDDDEREERGGPSGRGRGGRRNQDGGQRGGRKQNARQALKKTEEDFPSL